MSADFLLKRQSGETLSSPFTVHNLIVIARGLGEKACEWALAREFRLRQVPHDGQKQLPIFYQNTPIDRYPSDRIASDTLNVDPETVPAIGDEELGKLLTYRPLTGLKGRTHTPPQENAPHG